MLPILHAAATWAMLGVILTIQLVVYPQFLQVGSAEFLRYHSEHSRRITWIVGPVMALELVAAIALAVQHSESPVAWVGLACLAGIWGSTAFVQVPLHNRLAQGFSRDLVVRLIRTNGVRTALWAVRGVCAAYWLV